MVIMIAGDLFLRTYSVAGTGCGEDFLSHRSTQHGRCSIYWSKNSKQVCFHSFGQHMSIGPQQVQMGLSLEQSCTGCEVVGGRE
jgi:hypothetical protein